MAGDLIDEEMLDIVSKAPTGMFQFEIGIQSAKEETLEAIKRKTNLDKIESSVSCLIKMDNIHIHLDLIAGLPKEDILPWHALSTWFYVFLLIGCNWVF